MWKILLVFGFAVTLCGQAPPKKLPSTNDLASRKSFQELVDAHDQAILAAMNSEHAYACFRSGMDAFLLIVFDGPNASAWVAKSGNASVQQQAETPVFGDYKNGARAPGGVGLSVPGFWERAKGMEGYLNFHGETKEQGTQDDPDRGSIDIDGTEFSVTKTFKNLSGADTTYRFTLRLSTGRFTESYIMLGPKSRESSVQDSAGRCSIFTKGTEVTPVLSTK